MLKLKIFLTAFAFAALTSSALLAQNPETLIKESHLNYYYGGDNGKAAVTMEIFDKKGDKKVKEFSMVRLDLAEGGEQLYFIYFKKPSDIKRMTFMVKKYTTKDDERMLYVPAIDLVKKIAASDKSSSFVGSDFNYEDVSGRLWTDDSHELLGEEEYSGKAAFKIKSVPKEKDYFAHKITLIDKENKLPLREEYFDQGGTLFKAFTAEKVEVIQGIPTITARKMENVKKGQKTLIQMADTKYNLKLKKKYFSERYLKKPHASLK